MVNIIAAFQPYIDAAENFDIVHSKKFGWVMIIKNGRGEVPVFISDRKHLMIVLTETFFDIADGITAKEIAENARRMMAPYLSKLPSDCAEFAEIALILFIKTDEM